MTSPNHQDIEVAVFSELTSPNSLRTGVEAIAAKEFIAKKIKQAIGLHTQENFDNSCDEESFIVDTVDNPYLRFLRDLYDAANTDALLSSSQQRFVNSLLGIDDIIQDTHENHVGTLDFYQHLAVVATYINTCRG